MTADLIPPPKQEPIRWQGRQLGSGVVLREDVEGDVVLYEEYASLLRERDAWWQSRLREAVEAEREAAAALAGQFAQRWWTKHCAMNKHMETTRAAHDDFCALQIAIRVRSQA